MRWLILALIGLVGLSVGMTWVHPPGKGVGWELVEVMEKRGRMRGAVEVVDYVPEESMLAAVRGEKVTRGGQSFSEMGRAMVAGEWAGAEGLDLSTAATVRWVAWADARFTWRAVGAGMSGGGVEPLRAMVGEESTARKRVRYALGEMGWSADGAEKQMHQAVEELGGMTDAELREAWVRADRAVLVQLENVDEAVREGMLLVAREERGPALMFRVGGSAGKGSVDVFVLHSQSGDREQDVEMTGYGMDEKVVWTGWLSMDAKARAKPDFARERLLMVCAAEEAGGK